MTVIASTWLPPIGVILGLYWGYMGIVEKKMEPTIMSHICLAVVVLDILSGLGFRDPYYYKK